MSAPQWKPGDVAMIGSSIAFRTDREWRYRDGSSHSVEIADAFDYARPLVVIDPEDREQIAAFTANYDAAVIRMNDDPDPRDVTPEQRVTAMQSALLNLVTGPKPEEPQGLGAVVEDGRGVLWVRDNPRGGNKWSPESHAADGLAFPYKSWDHIQAVRVLSEGWSK